MDGKEPRSSSIISINFVKRSLLRKIVKKSNLFGIAYPSQKAKVSFLILKISKKGESIALPTREFELR